jgi:hypothetical protein
MVLYSNIYASYELHVLLLTGSWRAKPLIRDEARELMRAEEWQRWKMVSNLRA